jgi:GntR family transcriptional regulator
MLLNLTDLADESLQSQLVRQIRAKILTGDLKAGDDLPSIRRLAREQHISVITVQRAYEYLEREELIHARRGKGFFVSALSDKAKKDMAVQRLHEKAGPLIRAARAEGLDDEVILQQIIGALKKRTT